MEIGAYYPPPIDNMPYMVCPFYDFSKISTSYREGGRHTMLFKVNNKDTRAVSMTPFHCL